MTEALAVKQTGELSQKVEQVVIQGDLAPLTPQERVEYYNTVCRSLGLNPYTKPFDYISLNKKLTLYARKDATDQLRKLNQVSIDDVTINTEGNMFSVTVKGHDASGRSDVEIGVVSKNDMQGNQANAMMKAVTKAKRRLTLSLCGLGWLDETEIETIPDARPVVVDAAGNIAGQARIESKAVEAVNPANNTPVENKLVEAQEKHVFDEHKFLMEFVPRRLPRVSDDWLEKIVDSNMKKYLDKSTRELSIIEAKLWTKYYRLPGGEEKTEVKRKLAGINEIMIRRAEELKGEPLPAVEVEEEEENVEDAE